jgi:hypothetical protein
MAPAVSLLNLMPSLAMLAGPGPAGRIEVKMTKATIAMTARTPMPMPVPSRILLRRSRFLCSSRS